LWADWSWTAGNGAAQAQDVFVFRPDRFDAGQGAAGKVLADGNRIERRIEKPIAQ
jgi:hypothetical protein